MPSLHDRADSPKNYAYQQNLPSRSALPECTVPRQLLHRNFEEQRPAGVHVLPLVQGSVAEARHGEGAPVPVVAAQPQPSPRGEVVTSFPAPGTPVDLPVIRRIGGFQKELDGIGL